MNVSDYLINMYENMQLVLEVFELYARTMTFSRIDDMTCSLPFVCI